MSNENIFLVHDDNEAWRLLSNDDPIVDLDGFHLRFNYDHREAGSFWKNIVEDTRSLGFAITSDSVSALTSSSPSSESISTPVSFETSSGKKHVTSLRKLLGIDDKTVVQLTFGALQFIDTEKHLQSLLGTQSLFFRVLEFYLKQRIARLGILTELLRDASDGTPHSTLLDTLDKQAQLNNSDHRGLLQILLFAACGPVKYPSREQLQYLIENMGNERFVQQVVQFLSEQHCLERQQAMEALLSLFYSRLVVNCSEYCLILVALQKHCFFAEGNFNNRRLPQLTGLLCAEVINLNSAGPSHAYFNNNDFSILKKFVMDLSQQVVKRREKQLGTMDYSSASEMVIDSPESVAIFSVGLLVKLNEKNGDIDCLELGNKCGAFEYMHFLFTALLSRKPSIQEYHDDASYDWQLADSMPALLIESDNQGLGMESNLIIYTSIGLEILNTAVIALGDFLAFSENINLLCHLGAILYASRPVFCQEFWNNPTSTGVLVESAYGVPSHWDLLSALCSDRQSVDRLMTLMPVDYLLKSLASVSEEMNAFTLIIFSVGKLAKLNPSAIREALNDDPCILFQMLSIHPNEEIVMSKIFGLLASLIIECPPWAMAAVKFFEASSSRDLLIRCFNSESMETISASARLLHGLVDSMCAVCFSSRCSVCDTLKYINMAVEASLAACNCLSSMVSFSRKPFVSYIDANYILKITVTLLESLRQLNNLHKSALVRKATSEARVLILETFSKSTLFGQTVAYFAVAPISLSMSLLLEQTLQETNLTKFATEEFATDMTSSGIGKWHSLIQYSSSTPINGHAQIHERPSNMKNLRIDMLAMLDRGWTDSEFGPLHAAASALALIKTWFLEAEHFASIQLVENRREFLASISPHSLLISRATMPPVVRAISSLAYFWQSCALRTNDLLVHYLTNIDDKGYSLPFFPAIDLLSLSTSHAAFCGGITGQIFEVGGILFLSMQRCLIKIARLLSSDTLSIDLGAKNLIHRGILFVQLLYNLFEVDNVVATNFLDQDRSTIATALCDSVKALTADYVNEVPYRDRFVAESLSVIKVSKRYPDLCDELIMIAKIPREINIVKSEMVTQTVGILIESLLLDENPSVFEGTFKELCFSKDPVLNFRDCLVLLCNQISDFQTVTLNLETSMNLSSPLLFAESFWSGATKVSQQKLGLNFYNTKAASSLLHCLESQRVNSGKITSSTKALFTTFTHVKKQFETLSSWAVFVQSWAENNEHHECLQSIPEFLTNELYELTVLKVEAVLKVELSHEIEASIESLSNLLLHLIRPKSNITALNNLDATKIVKTIEIVIANSGSTCKKGYFASLSNLLAISALTLQRSLANIDLTKFVNIAHQSMFLKGEHHVFRSSLLVFAAILDSDILVNDVHSRIKVARTMMEQRIVRSLVEKISLFSALAIKDKDTLDEEQVKNVLSLFTLLLAIANKGEMEYSFLSLFVSAQSDVSKMFTSNPLFAKSSPRWTGKSEESNYRGYIKSSSKRTGNSMRSSVGTFLSGGSDNVHKIWRVGIRLVTTLVRLGSIYPKNCYFPRLFDNFTSNYDATIQSCLIHCCMIGQGCVFTRNILEEAHEILNLLSQGEVDEKYVGKVVSVVGAFGKFLGAIGTARLLSKLVREVETANQDQESPLEYVQELHPALARGTANASHEAIRYAHYARSSYAIVTSDDYKLFSKEQDTIPKDGNEHEEFEITCYRSINNSFAKEIESAVADCLTAALTFLSKNHPASKSFIPFSKNEISPMDIVKYGSIIAYHTGNGHNFARVISCDTVRRIWKCKVIESKTPQQDTMEISISMDKLLGVEDNLKRKALLRYFPAHDAATELETNEFGKIPTIGHLILALRWCRQDENGIKMQTRRALAEAASALLATELALHSEIGVITRAKDSVRKTLNDQLFDLFDKESRSPWLNECMDDQYFQCIQRQLAKVLDLARKDRVETRQLFQARQKALHDPNPWKNN